MQDFPFETPIAVRWGDQDAFGHVNNTLFFRYFEEARCLFFEKTQITLDVVANPTEGPIMAAADCQFRQQLTWPTDIVVGTRIEDMTNRSFKLYHQLWEQGADAIAAEGHVVIVWFDFQAQKAVPIPDALRASLENYR